MSAQPEANIGLVGHIDHGKTTLTEALSSEWTERHSEELKRGITIRLGYADTTFYKCPKCSEPECYCSTDKCPKCEGKAEKQRTISLVDAPGHETLMATMLSGAAIMDGAILVIAANEKCPLPQTKEHLTALEVIGKKNIVVVQNKIDLVPKERAIESYKEIKEFLKGSIAQDAPIIPISAQQRINIDVLIKAIEETIPTPKRDLKADPKMFVARSFDVNKPGAKIESLKGGVLGGALVRGELKVGDEIEIRPGRKVKEGKWEPVLTRIDSLFAGGKPLQSVHAGGSLGVGTSLDPSLAKSDGLSGNVAGHVGKLPPVVDVIKLETHLLEWVVGLDEQVKVQPINKNDILMLTAGTTTTVGLPVAVKKNVVELKLKMPVCADKGDRIVISRRIGQRWRLVGYGIVN